MLLYVLAAPETSEFRTSNNYVLAECPSGVLGSVHLQRTSRGVEALATALGELSECLGELDGQARQRGAPLNFVVLGGDLNVEFSAAAEPYVGPWARGAECALREALALDFLVRRHLAVGSTFRQIEPTHIGWGGEFGRSIDHAAGGPSEPQFRG